MLPVLAVALSLFAPPAGPPDSARLLDASLTSPLAGSGGDAAEKGVTWRVLGTTAGVVAGAAVGFSVGDSIVAPNGNLSTAITLLSTLALSAAGGYGGYVWGDVADEGSSGSRIGIGAVCAGEVVLSGILAVAILALAHAG